MRSTWLSSIILFFRASDFQSKYVAHFPIYLTNFFFGNVSKHNLFETNFLSVFCEVSTKIYQIEKMRCVLLILIICSILSIALCVYRTSMYSVLCWADPNWAENVHYFFILPGTQCTPGGLADLGCIMVCKNLTNTTGSCNTIYKVCYCD